LSVVGHDNACRYADYLHQHLSRAPQYTRDGDIRHGVEEPQSAEKGHGVTPRPALWSVHSLRYRYTLVCDVAL